jgi:hypothetical protein
MRPQIHVKSGPADRYGAYIWDLPNFNFLPFSKVVTFRSVMFLISSIHMSILRSCTTCKQENITAIVVLLYLMTNFINLKFTYLCMLPTNFWLIVILMSHKKYSYMLFWRHAYRRQVTWKHWMYIKNISLRSIKGMNGNMDRWKDGWITRWLFMYFFLIYLKMFSYHRL